MLGNSAFGHTGAKASSGKIVTTCTAMKFFVDSATQCGRYYPYYEDCKEYECCNLELRFGCSGGKLCGPGAEDPALYCDYCTYSYTCLARDYSCCARYKEYEPYTDYTSTVTYNCAALYYLPSGTTYQSVCIKG